MDAGESSKTRNITLPKISLSVISVLAIVIQVVAVLLLLGPGERLWGTSTAATETPVIPLVTDGSTLRTPQAEQAGSPIVLNDASATSVVTGTAIPTPVAGTTSRNLPATPTSALPATATPGQVSATVLVPATVTPDRSVTPTPQRATVTPPSPPATPTATASPTPVRLVDRVMEAEATLRSGVLEAVFDYGDGPDPSVRLTFDLGERDRPMRMQLVSTYPGQDGIQTVERIVIGQQAWQKTADGSWDAVEEQEGVWGQIQNYLPRIASADELYAIENPTPTIVIWHDAARDADVILIVDPETGVPARMEQHSRSTGTVTVVTYVTWNQPVGIEPPTGP